VSEKPLSTFPVTASGLSSLSEAWSTMIHRLGASLLSDSGRGRLSTMLPVTAQACCQGQHQQRRRGLHGRVDEMVARHHRRDVGEFQDLPLSRVHHPQQQAHSCR